MNTYWDEAARPRLNEYNDVFAHPHPASLNVTRQRLEIEISTLQRVASEFQAQLDRLPYIHIFPVEILARCFDFLADEDPLEMKFANTREAPLGWITVTHVCRHWRQVALGQSSLWRRPTFRLGHVWFSVILGRARSTPLSLHSSFIPAFQWMGPIPFPETITQAIESHADHLKSIRLWDFPTNPISMIASSLTQPTPMLHSIDLGNSFSLPPNFLGNATPNLRQINLRRVTSDWPLKLLSFRDLTRLEIAQDIDSPIPVPHSALLEILDGNPQLETLKLWDVFNDAGATQDPFAFARSRRISLPHLQLLNFSEFAMEFSSLLGILAVPETAEVKISRIIPGLGPSTSNCLPVFSALANHFYRHVVFRQLAIYTSGQGIYIHSSWHGNGDDILDSIDTPSLSGNCLDLEIKWQENSVDTIHAFLHTLPCREVNTLAMLCDDRVPELWTKQIILQHLPNVTCLRLEDEETLKHMSRAKVDEDGTEMGVELFPQLYFLEILHLDLSREVPYFGGGECRTRLEVLKKLLVRRKELGSPVTRLRFTGCSTIPPIDLSWLRSSVMQIDVLQDPDDEPDWEEFDKAEDFGMG